MRAHDIGLQQAPQSNRTGAPPSSQGFVPPARSGRQASRRALRRSISQVHLWLGLILGLVWAIQGLTGSLLVFHRELDRVADGRLTTGQMAPLDDLVAEAARASGRPIQRITAVGSDLRVVEARYDDRSGHPQALRLDAATARVVGHRDRDPSTPFTGSAWRWIYLVHDTLLSGDSGETLIGISGLFLLLSLSCGAYLGWPRRGQWRAAFSLSKWRTRPQKFYGWHRAVGLVSVTGVALLACTGAYMAFDTKITSGLGRIVAFNPLASMSHDHRASGHEQIHSAIGPGEALEIARSLFPSGKFMNLELPQEHPEFYSVRFTLPGEWRTWSGRATVQVEPTTGETIAVYDPLQASVFNQLDDVAYPVHLGEAGGLLGRCLVALAGLSLPVFYVTGVTMWLRKRRTRLKSRQSNFPG